MSHGKETPRQKMIGMMYLVLTAMLAMNVSADLLSAFALVDSGLSQTTRNYAAKNEKTFNRFTEAELLNPRKVGPWRSKAADVHQLSQELIQYVKDLKLKIVKEADGAQSPAVLPDGEVDGLRLEATANTDVPARVLIQEGAGVELKKKIVAYRDVLLGMLDKNKDSQLYEAVGQMLDTQDPPPTKDGIQHTWESYRFEHIPLIAVLPQLTKVQVDVLNAEADMMSYLLGKIDAGDFKFNRIGAVVIPNSDYVAKGGEFRAEIFLAASDTTQRPKIYLGRYDSVYNQASGEWNYEMKGGVDSVPTMPNGRGLMRRAAESVGQVDFGGLIEIVGPDGAKIRRPFHHRYTVAEPSFAVSPTKMNVLYLGVPNPIEVSVSGASPDDVEVSMTGGTISKSGNAFIAKPNSNAKMCDISVAVKEGSERRVMGVKKFRVKRVPDPLPTIWGMDPKAQSIGKGELLSAQGVQAKMPDDFDFDMKFEVLSFTMGVTVNGFYSEKSSQGARITAEQRKMLNNLAPGQIVVISNIRAKGPDGTIRELQKAYKIR